ncbi:MAG: hypothetical protein H0X33_11380 [Taibaiella sp.]|nr:hypothetical protein [Taibaiella sp.]
MRIVPIYLLLFTTIATLCFLSCTKTEKTPTPYDVLNGRWRLYQTGTDDNNNKILDDQELRTPDPNIINTLTFHYGDSGKEEISYYKTITDYYFTWKLPNSSQTLLRYMEGHDTLVEGIITFSPAKLMLLDSTTPAYSWYIYRKL